MASVQTALLAVVVGAISASLTLLLLRPGTVFYVLDIPNERSLHERPVPRLGGIAITVSLISGLLALPLVGLPLPVDLLAIVGSVCTVAVVSFFDDRRHVPILLRLGVHLFAAGVLICSGLSIEKLNYPGGILHLLPAAGMLLSGVFIVWMINLYNFMDGMDGFAGGMAVFGFGTYALLGTVAATPVFVATNAVIAAAAGGFLLFNFPPARIFMGDVGSSVLGLTAGAMSIWAERDGIFPLWVGLLIFSPFVVDATATLSRRILRRESFWRPHRSHYYQRLVRAGWGHRRTVLAEYMLMTIMSGLALGAVRSAVEIQLAVVVGSVAGFVCLAFGVRHLEKSRRATQGQLSNS